MQLWIFNLQRTEGSEGTKLAKMSSLWKQAKTADGRVYYYNSDTKATRWDEPEDFVAEAPQQYSQAQIDAAWKETVDKGSGKTYYYNACTKATSWTEPLGYIRAPVDAQPPRSDLVAGRPQYREDDNYRPRERRRDDRDHSLPQKPSFDGGRAGDRSWDRDQRQDVNGFRGPMPVKTDEPEYSTYEQAEEAFFKMLRKQGVSSDMTWEEAMREIIRERDYRALKEPRERRKAFEKYCQEVRAEEKSKEKERRERTREDFRKMLGTHDEITHYTRWKTARPIIEREAVFRSAGDDDERRQMFDEYIVELGKKHAEDQVTQRQDALQALRGLLQTLIVDADTKWADAQQSITDNEQFANEERFRALNNVDIMSAFDTHIKSLDRAANDAKQRDKRMLARRERQARDQFRDLLSSLHREGKVTAATRWQDFHPLIRDDERYLNLLGTSGSRPLELFWDAVEEEERKVRSLRNAAMDILEDLRYELTLDSTLEEFTKLMRGDARMSQVNDYDLPIIFERLMDKIRKRTEEDKAVNERHQRKAIDSLRSVIKHLDPPVRLSDSFEDVVPRLQAYEEFSLVSDDKLRRSAFEKHIRRLKEKEQDHDRDRDRSRRRDGDRDERPSSRRDRDHRHRTRTPEVDAYEADRRKAQADRERQYRKASFGLTPPPRERREERRDDRDDRYRRHDRSENTSGYERERRDREAERERNYISRADPRDARKVLDYGDDDPAESGRTSVRKRRESDGSGNGRREAKVCRTMMPAMSRHADVSQRPRRSTRSPAATEATLKEESPALQSGSEEGEIEEV